MQSGKMKRLIMLMLLVISIIVLPTVTAFAGSSIKAPTGVSVSANKSGKAVISWKKVSGAKGYNVYRKTSKDKSWVKVNSTSESKLTDSKCTAKEGSTVQYCVAAYKKSNGKTIQSKKSAIVKFKVPKSKVASFDKPTISIDYADQKAVDAAFDNAKVGDIIQMKNVVIYAEPYGLEADRIQMFGIYEHTIFLDKGCAEWGKIVNFMYDEQEKNYYLEPRTIELGTVTFRVTKEEYRVFDGGYNFDMVGTDKITFTKAVKTFRNYKTDEIIVIE